MEIVPLDQLDELRQTWTDQYVRVNQERPELSRFGDTIGRVITVNWNGKALIDFQDGAWYDITASPQFLIKVDAAEAKSKFNSKMNSAQPFPEKQS